MKRSDVIVVGGGIAGVSIAYELAATASVQVLEAEPELARHTTGRSAATWVVAYGPESVRRLTLASGAALASSDEPWGASVLSPLPMLTLARENHRETLLAAHRQALSQPWLAPQVELLTGPEAEALNPALRPGYFSLGLLDSSTQEVDVAALHQGYVRAGRAREVVVETRSRVVSAERCDGAWVLGTAHGTYRARVVVIAAGAWSDEVARLLGSPGVGIQPMRRSMFVCPAPEGLPVDGLPFTHRADGAWYWRPESGQLMGSPEDETPEPPGDPRADTVEVARAIEQINEATLLGLRSVRTSWAGQRSFSPDRVPVVGFDPVVEGVFWFAGQGGYGIQTAPAMARVGAALYAGRALDADLLAAGVQPDELSPRRFAG